MDQRNKSWHWKSSSVGEGGYKPRAVNIVSRLDGGTAVEKKIEQCGGGGEYMLKSGR